MSLELRSDWSNSKRFRLSNTDSGTPSWAPSPPAMGALLAAIDQRIELPDDDDAEWHRKRFAARYGGGSPNKKEDQQPRAAAERPGFFLGFHQFLSGLASKISRGSGPVSLLAIRSALPVLI
eukprot:gene17489-biopygen10254